MKLYIQYRLLSGKVKFIIKLNIPIPKLCKIKKVKDLL